MTDCVYCNERVKFKARERHTQVICNIYLNGNWDHIEHYHSPCYEEAGEPFGKAAERETH